MDLKTLVLALCVPCCIDFGFSQVPNGDFEAWSGNVGYENPDQWITTNNVSAANDMLPTCEKGSPGFSGDFYCSVTSRSGPNGIIAMGTMASGNPDSNKRGYPYSERPEFLTGQWQYGIMPFDLGQVSVTLSRWDATTGARMTVGSGAVWVMNSISSWETFHVPINYVLYDDPDTAVVTVAASASPFAVVAGSTIWVDEVKFEGTAGITDLESQTDVVVFPSPTSGPITIETSSPMVEITLLDLTGRTLSHRSVSGRSMNMDLQGLAPGRYLLGTTLSDGRKLVRSFVME